MHCPRKWACYTFASSFNGDSDSLRGEATSIKTMNLPLSSRHPSLPYDHLAELSSGWGVFFIFSTVRTCRSLALS